MQSNDISENNKKVGIIGVPLGYGAGRKGSELGVTALRLSEIRGSLLTEHIKELGYEVKDYGKNIIHFDGHFREKVRICGTVHLYVGYI